MIGVTITRYFAMRFLRTILAIFLTIFCLMFVVVFVELLRRVSDNPQTGAGTVALMTIMRVPYCDRDDSPLRGAVRLDGDLRRPHAQARTGRGARVGHVGLAVSDAARCSPPSSSGCSRSRSIIRCRRR